MSNEERRKAPRITTSLTVVVKSESGSHKANLVDLSLSGAGISAPMSLGYVGDEIELTLIDPNSMEIKTHAKIVRMSEDKSGFFYGIQIDIQDKNIQKQFVSLIESLLTSKGSGKRKHPRITRRIPIIFHSPNEIRAVLENISMGGAALTVEHDIKVGQQVEVSIPNIKGSEFMILQGTVAHRSKLEDNVPGYRIGVQFEGLTDAITACLHELIKDWLSLHNG